VTKRTVFEALIFMAAPESAEADELDGSLLHAFGDGVEHGVERVGGGAFGGFTAEVFLHGFDELSFVHEIELIRRWFDCGPRQK